MTGHEKQNPPPFPTEKPGFVDMLCHHDKHHVKWDLDKKIKAEEVNLKTGLSFYADFSDPEGLLITANESFIRFLKELPIPYPGSLPVVTQKAKYMCGESFRIDISKQKILLKAGNTEGLRRGIYYLKDLLAGTDAPALKTGIITHTPWLKNRISRCFFGPIKRPPFFHDELMDEIDYYPEEYLNRLAQESVNGLWLTVSFRDVCETSITTPSPDAAKRLEKLRKTVERCRRYGIKIWAFCTEPAGWSQENPAPEGYNELIGPEAYGKWKSFCPNSKTAEKYLYESTNYLFRQVPNLGGLITISHGERITSCLSCVSLYSDGTVPCNRTCSLSNSEIFSKVLTPMRSGIRDASPDAEMISWLYMPHSDQPAEWIYQLPQGVPDDVILAYNFESGCKRRQVGKVRNGGDYWLSCTGPADRFGRMATMAQGNFSMAAKIQVACSHEVATIPFVPVPGQLYRKYKAMKNLGVEHVMQCWYFGNYPGVMNQAAGKLAYDDFNHTEEEFLAEFARPEWGNQAEKMAEVWAELAVAYENYPLDIQFQYYGPMHDGLVWSLHLKPVRKKLPRSWKPDYASAGDALGECMVNHSLNELIVLSGKLSKQWSEGTEKMQTFRSHFCDNSERESDFILIEALNLHFRSGYNILRFYGLRNRLWDASCSEGLKLLNCMKEIVLEEIQNSEMMVDFCQRDPRLGYHSEAEVYKYYPEKLRWRISLLETLLKFDFPEMRKNLENGVTFPEVINPFESFCITNKWYSTQNFRWRASNNCEEITFKISCDGKNNLDRESIRLFFMDSKMEKTPWWDLCIRRDGAEPEDSFQRQCSPRVTLTTPEDTVAEDILLTAAVKKIENGNAWTLEIKIPRAALEGANEFWFGIQHDWRDANQKMHFENFPAGEYHQEDRLFLGYYAPEKLIKLKLN